MLIGYILMTLNCVFDVRAYSNENWTNLTECNLPSACRFQKVSRIIDASGIEKMLSKDKKGLLCDINEGISLDIDLSEIRDEHEMAKCSFKGDAEDEIVELRWSKSDTSTFDHSLNISSLLDFVSFFYSNFSLNLANIKRFGINISNFDEEIWKYDIKRVYCSNCRFDFYIDEEHRLKSCDDFIQANVTRIQSVFQMYRTIWDEMYGYRKDYLNFTIISGDFKDPICPLVFNDSWIQILQLFGLVDSFYKRNVLSFSNFTFDDEFTLLVTNLQLDKVENIDLDFKLLNPYIFKGTRTLFVFGSINRIDEEIFKTFDNLYSIGFKTNYFRKIMHTNGIKWIRAINSNLRVNISDGIARLKLTQTRDFLAKFLNLDCYYYSQEVSMPTVFPDEDFCLYVDYPFEQVVILIQFCGESVYHDIHTDFSCTFMWLIQYYRSYCEFLTLKSSFDVAIYKIQFPLTTEMYNKYILNLYRIFNNPNYNLTMAKCNFSLMKSFCNKSQYSVSDIWGLYDYSILTKKLEISFKISSYAFSFLGIITNLIVIITILHKNNSDIFKGFKQYNYLCYNGIFSMWILVIQLFSWLTECFYPYEVFCPVIRKLVFVQVFKMVFKECLVTTLRFMWNFTYIAFTLNRVSLIGKDHGKLVQFMSEVGVKSYIFVCFLLSSGFSVVKYFKYEINYDQPETNYPISNDHDLSSIHRTHISNDGVIITNSIFDILNYVVFEVVIFIVDIYMVVRLRRVLNEKMKKSESLMGILDPKKLEAMKIENEDTINKVIKMVILNTAISVLFKLPIAFIPVVNVVAEFYYKDYLNQFNHPKFGEFYSFLQDSGFYDMIVVCSDMFYTISLFIQLFIYLYFDKKFKMSTQRIFNKT